MRVESPSPTFVPIPWATEALCAGKPTIAFYPEGRPGEMPTSWVHARDLCGRCPVADECLGYALDNRDAHGLWGGIPPKKRRALSRLPRDEAIEAGRKIREVWANPSKSVRRYRRTVTMTTNNPLERSSR